MEVKYGHGKSIYGTGVDINLSGEDIAMAIDAYLVAHGIYVHGPRTIRVNGELCQYGKVYVDPTGSVVHDGVRYHGDNGKVVTYEQM